MIRRGNHSFSVSKINTFISNLMGNEPFLKHVTVEGEVSNLKYHNSGHIYFALKDEKSKLSAIMYKSARGGLTYPMKDGDKVLATGSIGVFLRDGTYQLYAKYIESAGAGELYVRYEGLKKELSEMGMFDEAYKKPIPQFISHLGIVTAQKGAAVRDIIRIAKRRNPKLRITIYPAIVQGEGAAESIAEGIKTLDEMGVDVIIAGRGGGSIEDLWAFNEEAVARAIFSCSTPVISAVGHETDNTIADFVADKRAATPSEAAELAVNRLSETYESIEAYREALYERMLRKIDMYTRLADRYEDKLRLKHPLRRIEIIRESLKFNYRALNNAINRILSDKRQRVAVYASQLEGASPAKRLAAGYSYIADESGRNLKSIKNINKNDKLTAYMTDGRLKLLVDEVLEYE